MREMLTETGADYSRPEIDEADACIEAARAVLRCAAQHLASEAFRAERHELARVIPILAGVQSRFRNGATR